MTFLENFALQNKAKIREWVSQKMEGKKMPFYSSCDVRYSGFKVTQVDANCFPAGFNNLNLQAFTNAVRVYRDFFKHNCINTILIYPEFHTRNFGYLKNVRTLKAIFEEAGAVVKVATNLESKFNIDLSQSEIRSISDELGLENSLDFEPIKKCKWFFQKKYKIGIGLKKCCFIADAVILNNDLTSGMPGVLNNIVAPVYPSPKMGWWNRKKTEHFTIYSQIVEEFAQEFQLDPWFFDAYFKESSNIDFKAVQNFNFLEESISEIWAKIKKKYDEYGIKASPTIFIKSNFGTYGMGIHTIQSLEEIREFNKNIRKKMSVVKDGMANTSLIIQEGVETSLFEDQKAVEPVVYSANGSVIGMFFRTNEGKNANLNSKGMELKNDFPLNEGQKILCEIVGNFANLAITKEEESK
jgi:glutamate--cysteine ligase